MADHRYHPGSWRTKFITKVSSIRSAGMLSASVVVVYQLGSVLHGSLTIRPIPRPSMNSDRKPCAPRSAIFVDCYTRDDAPGRTGALTRSVCWGAD
jgi:hypothetical protein